MRVENHWRSILKAVSWRLFGTLVTMAIVFVLTRDWTATFGIGGLELFGKIFIYYIHERLWSHIPVGVSELKPGVFWFTGLSGAGKTTLAKAMVKRLRTLGLKVEYLDGDETRAILPQTGFTEKDRKAHIQRVAYLASILERHGITVVTALISPFKESRGFARGICKNFAEVYVSTPLEECERRDVKGLYARARRGEIKDFTGIDSPFEAPTNPEFEVSTHNETFDKSLESVVAFAKKFLGVPLSFVPESEATAEVRLLPHGVPAPEELSEADAPTALQGARKV